MIKSKRLQNIERQCCVTGRAYRKSLARLARHILRRLRPFSYPCGYSGLDGALRLGKLGRPFYVYHPGYPREEHTHISEQGFIDAEGHGCAILGWEHFGQRVLVRLAAHVEQHGFQTPEQRKKAA